MSQITITDEDIAEAEKAVLGEGTRFNAEQKDFIRCLETIDLTACPGSGKTTALVAKLYILAKHEVWALGQPICVVSHTRNAVDEIKEKVATHFPKIMDYPNFIGTIQEFVDRYLAIPYYKSLGYGEIKSIDDEIFANKWMGMGAQTRPVYNWLVTVGNRCHSDEEYRAVISNLSYDHEAETKIKTAELFVSTTNGNAYKHALGAKEELFKGGYLTYSDTRVLAKKYLEKYPNVSEVLRRRFYYVFLDEAQDTSGDQMAILDCFNTAQCYQRIGDPLQTIYNADNETTDAWIIRTGNQYKTLSKTNRFGSAIANLVNAVGDTISENAAMTSDNERAYQECVLVLFDDENPRSVIEWFDAFVEQELTFIDGEKDIYVVGAVGKEKEGRYTLNSYSPSYKRDASRKGKYFRNPRDYFVDFTPDLIQRHGTNLVYDRLIKMFTSSLKSLNDSLIKRDIKEKIDSESEPIAALVLKIANDVIKNQGVPYDAIAEVLHAEALRLFSIDDLSVDFQSVEAALEEFDEDIEDTENSMTKSTIHGIKGQTHDATLLVTTQYYTLGGSKKTGEIGGTDVDYLVKNSTRSEKRRKLLYVAASRPRYLFAWAIPKSKSDKAHGIAHMFTRVIEL